LPCAPEDVRFQGIAVIGRFSREMARWLVTHFVSCRQTIRCSATYPTPTWPSELRDMPARPPLVWTFGVQHFLESVHNVLFYGHPRRMDAL
jgi:hypothetical protein